jgi:uncharacterized protein YybS (DUF2232 family)
MNGKFFKYTLILLGVALIFIIIGGISVARVKEYENTTPVVEMVEVSKQEYEDMEASNIKLGNERQEIVDILHEEITDEEKIDKIEAIFFETEEK